jgi:hypothetical protein
MAKPDDDLFAQVKGTDAGRRYLNHYHCPCDCEWTDEWDCMCDDRCPECNTSCSPHESEDL